MSRGHGDKLTRLQEQAVAALLQNSTLAAAAGAVGVDAGTLRDWLRDPEFARLYSEARRELLERTVARLLAVSGQAVDALERNLDAERPADQLKAAALVLEHAARGAEVLDLAREVAELRRLIEEMQHGDSDPGAGGGTTAAETAPAAGPAPADPRAGGAPPPGPR